MANCLCFWSASGYKFGEAWNEIVAAPLFEFGGQTRGPVSSVGFEGVREDGIGRGCSEGLDERLTDFLKVGCDGVKAEGIEHPAFSFDGGSLDLLDRKSTRLNSSHLGIS